MTTATATVLGAGIGGLAVGILARRAGFEVTVTDQEPGPPPGGAAVLLHPNGLAVLDAIGVSDRLREAGSELATLRLLDDRLHVIGELDLPGEGGEGNALVVERSVVLDALTGRARDDGVDLDPSPVGDLGAVADRDLVIGAEGAWPVLRGLFGDGADRVTGRLFLRALAEWSPAPSLVGEHWTRRGVAGLLPCGGSGTYWYATATTAVLRAFRGGEIGALRRVVAAAHPPLLQVVNASTLERMSLARTRVVAADRLYRDNVVLVSDAGSGLSPNLGQGANSALVDAGVLASELHRREGLTEALAAFDARRSPALARVRADADRMVRLAHLTRGRRVRNAAIGLVPDRVAGAAVRRAQQIDLVSFRHELRDLPPG